MSVPDRAKNPKRVADVAQSKPMDYYEDQDAQRYFNAMGFNKGINKNMNLAAATERSVDATKNVHGLPHGKKYSSSKDAVARIKTLERIQAREESEGYEGVAFGSKRGEK